jgi:hypothetical protein
LAALTAKQLRFLDHFGAGEHAGPLFFLQQWYIRLTMLIKSSTAHRAAPDTVLAS